MNFRVLSLISVFFLNQITSGPALADTHIHKIPKAFSSFNIDGVGEIVYANHDKKDALNDELGIYHNIYGRLNGEKISVASIGGSYSTSQVGNLCSIFDRNDIKLILPVSEVKNVNLKKAVSYFIEKHSMGNYCKSSFEEYHKSIAWLNISCNTKDYLGNLDKSICYSRIENLKNGHQAISDIAQLLSVANINLREIKSADKKRHDSSCLSKLNEAEIEITRHKVNFKNIFSTEKTQSILLDKLSQVSSSLKKNPITNKECMENMSDKYKSALQVVNHKHRETIKYFEREISKVKISNKNTVTNQPATAHSKLDESNYKITQLNKNPSLSIENKVKICKAYIGNLFGRPTSIIDNYSVVKNNIYVKYIRSVDNTTWKYVCHVKDDSMVWATWFDDVQEWGRWRYEDQVGLIFSSSKETVSFTMRRTGEKISVDL